MPANLTPQYLAAEQRFKQAATTQEKIEALEEMMALIPKHKGTEKMQADLRRRLAKLRTETEKKGGASRASAMHSVPREGAGQIVLLGAPNVGKSSILARMTKANPEIADYPFTTRLPQPGMMPFENIQIQLIDMPPISPHLYEPWMGGIIRQTDLSLLVADLGTDAMLDEIDEVLSILLNSRIQLAGKPAVVADSDKGLLVSQYRALMIANKLDATGARENLEILRELFSERFEIIPFSSSTGEGSEVLRRILFERLGIIRVYTKAPGKKADLTGTPYTLKQGSTVMEVARAVHRDFVHTLKFAKVWSSEKSHRSIKFDGQMVERSHQLEDGDILELHV
jgi:uncharacterized protein